MSYPFRELPKEIAEHFKADTQVREGETVHVPVEGRHTTFTDDENVGVWDAENEVEYIMWTGRKWYISCTHENEFEAQDQELIDYITVWPVSTPLYQGKKA